VSGMSRRLWGAAIRLWRWLGPDVGERVAPIPLERAERSGPMQLECGWSNPVSVAATWAIAKAAGGTLDYRLRSYEDIVIEVCWVADREVQALAYGAPRERIRPGESVTVVFYFHVTECRPSVEGEGARVAP